MRFDPFARLASATVAGALWTLSCGAPDQPVDASTDPGTAPAILLAVVADNPEGRHIYVAAVARMPKGPVDLSKMREFDNIDVETQGGHVYVWDRETAQITKFGVSDDYELSEELTISLINEGLADSQEWIFASDTRAYVLSPSLDFVVVWNPQTMEITGRIPIELPERYRAYEETFFHKPVVVGEHVFWQVVSDDWDAGRIYHAATLAVLSTTTDEPVRFIEDDRCAGLNGGYVDSKGDYYARADGYWGYLVAYAQSGADSVETCVLRVRAGETKFDSEYFVRMEDITGSRISFPWFHVEDSKYVSFPRTEAVPEDREQYWVGQHTPLLVDVLTGDSKPYPDLDGVLVNQSREYEIDGTAYFERSLDDRLVTVTLHASGMGNESFTSTGIWALKRIR